MDGSWGGGPSCSSAAQEHVSCFFGDQTPYPFFSSPVGCRETSGFPRSEQLELDIEAAVVEAAKPAVSTRRSSGSKRSRAAEVHNLSEKRRRSRINEKMRALQNLIPNSNKTDKASMLDEAIEYLKQLQLQVQLLSMRNGLNLHDMYLSGMVQSPLQASEICMGFTGGNRTALNTDKEMLHLNQEPFSQNQHASSHQIQTIVAGLPASQGTFQQLPITADMRADGLLLQQQIDAGPAPRNTTDEMKTLVPHFGDECSLMEGHDKLRTGIISREESQNMLSRNFELQFNIHHLDGLQSGRSSVDGSDIKEEFLQF